VRREDCKEPNVDGAGDHQTEDEEGDEGLDAHGCLGPGGQGITSVRLKAVALVSAR